MMEKLGMPPQSMMSSSRVFSRYFCTAAPNQKVYNQADKDKPMTTLPRYCTIHRNDDGTATLRQNISKKTNRLRKPPGAFPIDQALRSTFSHSSGKHNQHTLTRSEDIDNRHVVKLIEACLKWIPENRISPDDAKRFSWFNYLVTPLMPQTRPVSLLIKSTNSSVEIAKNVNRTKSQVPLVNEILSTRKISVSSNGQQAPTVNATVPAPFVEVDSRPNVNSQEPMACSSTVASTVRKNATFASSIDLRHHYRGSPASISSGENKQEERVLYARSKRSTATNLMKNSFDNYNHSAMKKISDVSLLSIESLANEIDGQIGDNALYTRRHGGGNERFPDARKRKGNRSLEMMRHTQPVGNEAMVQERNFKPVTKQRATCQTAAINLSPDAEPQRSGRHNPNHLSTNSTNDLTTINSTCRLSKQSTSDGQNHSLSTSTKQKKYWTQTTETPAIERKTRLNKTMSAVDFSNLNTISLDESDIGMKSTDVALAVVSQFNIEPKMSDPGPKLTGSELRLLNGFKSSPIRSNAQQHTDFRRRKVSKKSKSTIYLDDFSTQTTMRDSAVDVSLSRCNVRAETTLREASQPVLEISGTPRSTMMIRPQN